MTEVREQIDWLQKFKDLEALWIHDGDPQKPHALLTGGKHSNGFFNSGLIMESPPLLHDAVLDLSDLLWKAGCHPYMVERVVGPAVGAIPLAYEMARSYYGHDLYEKRRFAYTEKDGDKFKLKRTTLRLGEKVLLVEDVITTGDSVELSAQAIEEAGGEVLPYVGALVNRSEFTCINGREIITLVRKPLSNWEPADCPHCKTGSEALRPKANWALLNGISVN